MPLAADRPRAPEARDPEVERLDVEARSGSRAARRDRGRADRTRTGHAELVGERRSRCGHPTARRGPRRAARPMASVGRELAEELLELLAVRRRGREQRRRPEHHAARRRAASTAARSWRERDARRARCRGSRRRSRRAATASSAFGGLRCVSTHGATRPIDPRRRDLGPLRERARLQRPCEQRRQLEIRELAEVPLAVDRARGCRRCRCGIDRVIGRRLIPSGGPRMSAGAGARYVLVGYGATEGRMKFFIDTADIKEIREAAAMGLVDGVTTNPSLVAKTGKQVPRRPPRDLRHRQGPGLGRGRQHQRTTG